VRWCQYWVVNGLVGGLEIGLAGGFLGFCFCFFETFNRGGHPNVPAVRNRLTAAGKAVRRGKATIYRDLFTLADAFARCAKANSPAAENVSVVVHGSCGEIAWIASFNCFRQGHHFCQTLLEGIIQPI